MVSTLERDYARICLMGPETAIKPGNIISRTKKFITVPVGHALLGRVVNSLGKPIDGKGPLRATRSVYRIKNLKNALHAYALRKGLTKMNFTKYKAAKTEEKKMKRKGSKELTKNAKGGLKKTTRYTRQFAVNLTKAMSAVRLLLKVNKTNLKSGIRLSKTSGLKTLRVERPAPGIMERRSIHEPLITGTKVVDAVIPIGRGQRELILGDRNTGKTTIAIDAVISQTRHNKQSVRDKIYSIYVAIGQRQAKVQEVVNVLKKTDALQYSIIVFAPSYAPAILQFIAPYTGTTMGEYFRDKGYHSLVIYDDLTKHAQIHRQLSLLLKTPPGREAYPGDVFYVHARLLERSAKLSKKKIIWFFNSFTGY